jgi:AcrR family transcriptional regulator
VAKTATVGRSAKPTRGRPAGQAATRDNILHAAIDIFAQHGFAGARVDEISRAARSTDRMIYYYFGSKERLFVEVLETIYRRLGEAEKKVTLADHTPEESLRLIFRFTWNYYQAHPEMLTLLNNENLQKGRHVARSKRVKELSLPLISILSDVLERGIQQGVFRKGVSPRGLYIAICALGYFYLSNRFTLSAFLDTDLMRQDELTEWSSLAEDMLLRYVAAR